MKLSTETSKLFSFNKSPNATRRKTGANFKVKPVLVKAGEFPLFKTKLTPAIVPI